VKFHLRRPVSFSRKECDFGVLRTRKKIKKKMLAAILPVLENIVSS